MTINFNMFSAIMEYWIEAMYKAIWLSWISFIEHNTEYQSLVKSCFNQTYSHIVCALTLYAASFTWSRYHLLSLFFHDTRSPPTYTQYPITELLSIMALPELHHYTLFTSNDHDSYPIDLNLVHLYSTSKYKY